MEPDDGLFGIKYLLVMSDERFHSTYGVGGMRKERKGKGLVSFKVCMDKLVDWIVFCGLYVCMYVCM